MTPFPDDTQLDEYAELLEDEGGPTDWTEEMAAMAHEVAAFLRSPALREALRTQEAENWLKEYGGEVVVKIRGERRAGDETYVGEGGNLVDACKDNPIGFELVTRLRASRPGLEAGRE